MTRRLLAVFTLAAAGLLGPVSQAVAEPNPPPKCFRMNANGELPTCTWDGAGWSVDYPSFGVGGGAGIPGWFVAVFVLVLLAGIGLTVWRVSTARQLARNANLDTGQATAMALLDNDGLEATYLAANLRGQQPQRQPVNSPRSAESRLRELQHLRDDGLITEQEYTERRQAILGSL